MQVTGRRSLRRLDLGPVERLVPALVAEWRELGFDAAGRALDPRDGSPTETFRLVSGTHRRPGARYRVVSRPPGETSLEADVVLRRDEAGSVSVSVSSLAGTWSVDVDLTGLPDGPLSEVARPRCELTGEVDLVRELRRADLPGPAGWLSTWLVGRSASGSAVLDVGALDAGRSPLARARGGVRRASAEAGLEVTASLSRWELVATVEVAGRGAAGLALRVARRWVEPHVVRGLEQALDRLADADAHDRDLAHLAARTEAAGGPRALVRDELWSGPDADRAVVGPGTYS